MKKPVRSRKAPADPNVNAARIVAIATGTGPPAPPEIAAPKKNRAAVSLGRRGGKKGGPARAAALTQERRSEIAAKAAKARWGMKDDD